MGYPYFERFILDRLGYSPSYEEQVARLEPASGGIISLGDLDEGDLIDIYESRFGSSPRSDYFEEYYRRPSRR